MRNRARIGRWLEFKTAGVDQVGHLLELSQLVITGFLRTGEATAGSVQGMWLEPEKLEIHFRHVYCHHWQAITEIPGK